MPAAATPVAFSRRLLAGAAAFAATFVIPVLAAAATMPDKPYSTTTVFFVTDQRPSAKGERQNGFDDDRYTYDIGPCANGQKTWSDDCGLRYGYAQWDKANKPYYIALTAAQFYTAIGKPAHALIFLHGFDVRFSSAVAVGRIYAASLDRESGARAHVPVIVYGWPSAASTLNRVTFGVDYPNDETNNQWTRLHLRAFFGQFARSSPTTRLTIVAHSLGNDLALDILSFLHEVHLGAEPPALPGVPTYAGYRIAHFIAIEPDVDTQTFAESIATFEQSTVDDVTVYGNPDDAALGLSERFHGHCRAGLLNCEPLYAGQFSGAAMPAWLNVIDAELLARKCDPAFQHSYYTSQTIVADVSGLALDRTKLMTLASLRPHMQYSAELRGQPIPHFWLRVTRCA